MFSANVTGELFAVAALALFSMNIVLTKVAAARLNLNLGFLVSVSVNVLFAGLLSVVHLLVRNDRLVWNWPGFWLFLLAGAFSTWLGRWFFLESVVRFGPSRASVFQITSPVFTAVMAWAFLHETLQPLELAGMGMAVGGLLLVVLVPVGGSSPTPLDVAATPAPKVRAKSVLFFQSALVLGIGSSIAYSFGNIFRGSGIRAWDEALLGALIGASGGLVLHVLFSKDKALLASRLKSADRGGVALFAFSGVVTISAQTCLIVSLKYIPVSVASLITLCTPVLVFPLSYLLFKNSEKITRKTVIGGLLTLCGVALIVVT
ncbi:MAG: DMT family transporter [Polaromonas sp.]|nr:DMT family transporter [Polaromonas sp.]